MIKTVVICEDDRLDQYILTPVINQIFKELGQKVRIQFVPHTEIQGFNQAVQKAKHKIVLSRYPMADVFFLIIDRDGNENRENGKFADRLADAAASGNQMFGCLAVEELEVWALALHHRDLNEDWETIRKHRDPKEAYFEPFARQKKWHTGPGKGRKSAMNILRQKWDRLKNRCPELNNLTQQVQDWFQYSK
ncbi:MAG: hypothetical protein IH899_10300 [Planctomycetes bacterium]|nr:hypothetical protein [Planctomycetota bacterium]